MLFRVVFLWLFTVQVFAIPGGYPNTPPDNAAEKANYEQKLGWFIRFADAFMYPNNTVEAAKINSTLFADNVQGRVDMTTTFDGRELNTEVRLTPHPHCFVLLIIFDYRNEFSS